LSFEQYGSVLAAIALLGVPCGGCARTAGENRKLTIAAAADLTYAMDDIAREFRRARPDVELPTSYGSSGNFYSQIRNGAPFDVYLSADVAYPRKLIEEKIGVRDSLFVYGVGRIVVWVPAASKLDPAAALRDATLKRLAIANPQHAPYGRAAEAALRSLGVYDGIKDKLVLGEDISQTFGFVRSGAAGAGIVALSLALAPSSRAEGRYWEIPLDAYPRIEQGGLLLKDSADSRAFRAFLVSAGGRGILKRYGFYMPEDR